VLRPPSGRRTKDKG